MKCRAGLAFHNEYAISKSIGIVPLSGDGTGLPVIVIVESTNPAVVIDGLIQVNFVARGAEFGGLIAHESFHEGAAMRFGIQVGDKFFSPLDERALAGGKAM